MHKKKLRVAKAHLLSAEHRLSYIQKQLSKFIQSMEITIIEDSMNDDSELNRSLLDIEVMDTSADPQLAAHSEASQSGDKRPIEPTPEKATTT